MSRKVILIVIIALLVVLTWAPWLSNDEATRIVLSSDPQIGNRFHSDPGCGKVEIYPVPLGKWVGDCEGGYVVAFWGQVLGSRQVNN